MEAIFALLGIAAIGSAYYYVSIRLRAYERIDPSLLDSLGKLPLELDPQSAYQLQNSLVPVARELEARYPSSGFVALDAGILRACAVRLRPVVCGEDAEPIPANAYRAMRARLEQFTAAARAEQPVEAYSELRYLLLHALTLQLGAWRDPGAVPERAPARLGEFCGALTQLAKEFEKSEYPPRKIIRDFANRWASAAVKEQSVEMADFATWFGIFRRQFRVKWEDRLHTRRIDQAFRELAGSTLEYARAVKSGKVPDQFSAMASLTWCANRLIQGDQFSVRASLRRRANRPVWGEA